MSLIRGALLLQLVSLALCSDLPPLGLIPAELVAYFHPEDFNDPEHFGIVQRGRRASAIEDPDEDEQPTYTLFTQEGAPCILVQTRAFFLLDYRTLRHGIKTARIDLPEKPELSGSCVRTGITAVLTFIWSRFRFSLVFTENPEGNSYYLNTAKLEYTQSEDLFPDTTYKGHVILTTLEGGNFYFTPLGKSYSCENGEDQGPLPMYNEDGEVAGNLTMYKTRFQPFVKRAKGDWGPASSCLPKAIQVMRENVMPYVSSLVFTFSVVIMISGYGVKRYFVTQKAAYQFYGDDMAAGQENAGHGGYQQEMTVVLNGNGTVEANLGPAPTANPTSAKAAAATSSNPFKQENKSNPFHHE